MITDSIPPMAMLDGIRICKCCGQAVKLWSRVLCLRISQRRLVMGPLYFLSLAEQEVN